MTKGIFFCRIVINDGAEAEAGAAVLPSRVPEAEEVAEVRIRAEEEAEGVEEAAEDRSHDAAGAVEAAEEDNNRHHHNNDDGGDLCRDRASICP